MNPPPPKLLTHCPLCNAAYDEAGIRVLNEGDAGRLYHLTCPSCAHAVLAVIMEHQSGVSSIGVVTDLEAEDAVRFRAAEPVSTDDCVNAHEMLLRHSREVCAGLMKK